MLTVVPSYIGGFMALVWGSKTIDMINGKIVKGRKKLKLLLQRRYKKRVTIRT